MDRWISLRTWLVLARLMDVAVVIVADVRHEDEVRAAAMSSKTESSRVAKELEATKATLAQRKMAAETLNSQVSIVLLLTLQYSVFTDTNTANETSRL